MAFWSRISIRYFVTRRYSSVSGSAPNELHHIPVLCKEVLDKFNPEPGNKYLDLTFGAGGHSKRILESAESVTVYGLDRDPTAFELGLEMAKINTNLVPLLGRFSELPQLLAERNIGPNFFDGILIDCGCSSMQYDLSERGFSISKTGPLDMRMDKGRLPGQPTAADILAHISEENLARALKVYGEEKQAKKIARGIIESRYMLKDIRTTTELAELVASVLGFESRSDKLQRPSHVATKTFQALRILVNDELNELDFALKAAHYYLKNGGKLITIAFHSLEDRIIKSHLTGIALQQKDDIKFKNHDGEYNEEELDKVLQRRWQSLSKHVIVPDDEEVERNPRSRSAKMRVAAKKIV